MGEEEEPIYSETRDGFTVNIFYDAEEYNDPRTDRDNLGKMLLVHRRYQLGDYKFTSDSGLKNGHDIRQWIEDNKITIKLPVYMYEHSGITVSTSPFSCNFDSGQIGYIVATDDDIRKAYCVTRITRKIRERAIKCLIGEVKEYDMYLTGDVYGYRVLNSDGEELDSCWGFFGLDYCKSEALAALNYFVDQNIAIENNIQIIKS